MATAAKKTSSPSSKAAPGKPAPLPEPVRRGVGYAVFRFFASLKLAVFSLSTLAILLTVGMFFEREFGNQALQDYIYRTWWFGLLLLLLGTNILCAALIRYPWKKRQAGFVVTHAGLLVLVGGSFVSFWTGDEGQVGMVEGDNSATLVRTTDYRTVVQPVDPESGTPTGDSYSLSFYPGAFNWRPGREVTLTRAGDPFELKVTAFYPASAAKFLHESVEQGGRPMIALGLEMTPPNALTPIDPFQQDFLDRERWFTADEFFARQVKPIGEAARVSFQYLNEKEDAAGIEDFLDLPEDGKVEVARLRYPDSSGRERRVSYFPEKEEWLLENGETRTGRSIELPDSDLTATYQLSGQLTDARIFSRMRTELRLGPHGQISLGQFLLSIMQGTGDEDLPLAEFTIRKGDGPESTHWGLPLPKLPALCFRPSAEDPNVFEPGEQLARVSYYYPPEFEQGMQGVRGVIDILGTDEGRFFYRSINREGVQNKGRIKQRETVTAFGGSPNQPMTLAFSIDQFLKSGVEKFAYVPIEMPVGQKGNGIPAARIEMTSNGRTQEAWTRLAITADLKPRLAEAKALSFPSRRGRGDPEVYKVWFDVERVELPFEIELVDFRRRFDPGTQQAASYESDVLLTDRDKGLEAEPVNISMNEPLTHRGYTFYQSSFDPPDDGSGKFVSVFQVRYDPYWQVIYIGCLMIVLGAFMQFYMRAGIFTDGGKRESEKAAARARKRGETPPQENPFDAPAPSQPTEEPL
ncbi:hypothetical protein BH23PLA1_BH23PLA1_25060 [soil metagenome]